MSDKTELPIEWQQEAENVAEIAGNYLQGAKAMRDAMEKMLKDELVNSKEQSPYIMYLQKKLTSLTPTQDGK